MIAACRILPKNGRNFVEAFSDPFGDLQVLNWIATSRGWTIINIYKSWKANGPHELKKGGIIAPMFGFLFMPLLDAEVPFIYILVKVHRNCVMLDEGKHAFY